MKEDGKCLECQLEQALKERDKWKAEALKQAENAVHWENRARIAENKLKGMENGKAEKDTQG